MKKKKFLATILIASSALLGTGYSWWADGLQVQGIVSTGEFEVVGVESSTSTKDDRENGLTLSTIDGVEGFTYIIDDIYPNESYKFKAKFENRGTIPAKLADVIIGKEVKASLGTGDNVFKYLQVTGTIKVVEQGEGGKDVLVKEYSIKEDEHVTIDTLRQTLLEGQVIGWQLEKMQSIVFEDFEVELTDTYYTIEDKDNPHNLCEGFSVQFDLKLLFNQHNQI